MSLRIEINPAVDLAGSLFVYLYDDRLNRETGVPVPEEQAGWKRRVEETIPPFLANDLRFLFRTSIHYDFLLLLILTEGMEQPGELLERLETADPAEFLALYRRFLEIPGDQEVTRDYIRRRLENEKPVLPRGLEAEAEAVEEFFRFPGEFFRRLGPALAQFHRLFTADRLPALAKAAEPVRARHQGLLEADPPGFLNRITLDHYSSYMKGAPEVRIFITAADERSVHVLNKMVPAVIYGRAHGEMFSRQNPEEQTDQFLKALGDAKRLEILRLLKQRRWYSRELADQLGVSTATASYHLDKLVSARLVTFEEGRRRRIHYSINREGLREMLRTLEAEFLGERPDSR